MKCMIGTPFAETNVKQLHSGDCMWRDTPVPTYVEHPDETSLGTDWCGEYSMLVTVKANVPSLDSYSKNFQFSVSDKFLKRAWFRYKALLASNFLIRTYYQVRFYFANRRIA